MAWEKNTGQDIHTAWALYISDLSQFGLIHKVSWKLIEEKLVSPRRIEDLVYPMFF